jgi:hypothetical protein
VGVCRQFWLVGMNLQALKAIISDRMADGSASGKRITLLTF